MSRAFAMLAFVVLTARADVVRACQCEYAYLSARDIESPHFGLYAIDVLEDPRCEAPEQPPCVQAIRIASACGADGLLTSQSRLFTIPSDCTTLLEPGRHHVLAMEVRGRAPEDRDELRGRRASAIPPEQLGPEAPEGELMGIAIGPCVQDVDAAAFDDVCADVSQGRVTPSAGCATCAVGTRATPHVVATAAGWALALAVATRRWRRR